MAPNSCNPPNNCPLAKLSKHCTPHPTTALVLQDMVLFNDTIYYNIAYGDLNATKEQVGATTGQHVVQKLWPPLLSERIHSKHTGSPILQDGILRAQFCRAAGVAGDACLLHRRGACLHLLELPQCLCTPQGLFCLHMGTCRLWSHLPWFLSYGLRLRRLQGLPASMTRSSPCLMGTIQLLGRGASSCQVGLSIAAIALQHHSGHSASAATAPLQLCPS